MTPATTRPDPFPDHPFPYRWFWKSKLPERRGQPCKVVARGRSMNSVLVEFEDGFQVVTSRYAVRLDPAVRGAGA